MDYETLKKLGGKVDWIIVPYEVSLSATTEKDKWEGSGATAQLKVDVQEGADPEAVYRASYEYLKQMVVETAGPQMKMILKRREAKATPDMPKKTKRVYDNRGTLHAIEEELPQPPLPEPIREPFVGDAETETFKVDRITIEYSTSGTKYGKVKGGKWTKYGVTVWEEVLALPPLEWNIEALDAKDYGVPHGLEAVVLMDAGKPKKVLEWK